MSLRGAARVCRPSRSLPAQPLREPHSPGSARHPCAHRRARGRAGSRRWRRRGRDEAEPSSGVARPPWVPSGGPRDAQRSRDGARGCLTARSQSPREGDDSADRELARHVTGCVGGRTARARPGGSSSGAGIPGDCARRLAAGSARVEVRRGRRRTFSQGGECSARGRGCRARRRDRKSTRLNSSH